MSLSQMNLILSAHICIDGERAESMLAEGQVKRNRFEYAELYSMINNNTCTVCMNRFIDSNACVTIHGSGPGKRHYKIAIIYHGHFERGIVHESDNVSS